MPLRPDQLPGLAGLLDRLMAVPAAQRAAWVDGLQGDDAALAPALRDLLTHPDLLDEHAGTVHSQWSQPLRDAAALASGLLTDWQHGAMLGPWQLLSPLGEGGMGVVWLAERHDGTLKRQVALKLPRPGLQRWRLGERFARERDILAQLNHPHIARLFDAGITADGQAWLAMEVVQGQTITQHAEGASLSVAARLGLFGQVLSAVQHAHQRLVVHRDLKPSNILVDATGNVRLLDFGIALLQDEAQPQAALTELGQPLLTPQYAAPEQLAQQGVSTASDLYSLGVVLCELLSGHTPYKPTRAGRAALEEAVLGGELRRPSSLAPPARRRALRGDLDNIVLKALARDPARRYASADAFAQDIQRHLAGLPVLAVPPSWRYRGGKFVARNRAMVAAGGVVALALLAGAGTALWQARAAREQAAVAEREARRAQAVQGFLIGLFNEADPARAQGRELTARDLMARAERELRAQLGSEPDSMAAVRAAMVDIYLKLGDEKSALPLAQAQLEQARQHQGAGSAEAGAAGLALGRTLNRYGRHDAALATLTETQAALAPLAASPGPAADTWLAAGVEIASSLTSLRRMAESRDVLRPLLPRLARRWGERSWELIQAKSELAISLVLDGQVGEAAPLYAEIEPLLDPLPAGHELDATTLRADMGYAWQLSGRWDDGRRALERALADFDRLEGPRNSNSIRVQRSLAVLLQDSGNAAQAARVTDDNARRSAALYGAEDGEAALDQSFRVVPLCLTGRIAEGLAAARESVRIAEGKQGLPAADRRGLERRLGLALLFDGRLAEGLSLLQRLAEADERDGFDDGRKAATLIYLSSALRLQGQAQAGAERAAQAAAIWRRRETLTSQTLAARAAGPGPGHGGRPAARRCPGQAGRRPGPAQAPAARRPRAAALDRAGARRRAAGPGPGRGGTGAGAQHPGQPARGRLRAAGQPAVAPLT
jgi:serine/threonine-protein kinase